MPKIRAVDDHAVEHRRPEALKAVNSDFAVLGRADHDDLSPPRRSVSIARPRRKRICCACYRLPVSSFRRSGCRSRSLKRFTTAGNGADSPRSYRENALCPPPVSSAAMAWLRPSFLRMRRISDRCAARACSTSLSPAAAYRFALLWSNSISPQEEQRRPDRPLTSADIPWWETRNVSSLKGTAPGAPQFAHTWYFISLLLKLDHWCRVAHRDLDIGLLINRCGRIIDVLPNAVISVGRHRLIEVSPCQCCYDREHLTAGQSHVPAAIKRGLRECGGPEPRDLCLNGRKIVVRGRLLHTDHSTL